MIRNKTITRRRSMIQRPALLGLAFALTTTLSAQLVVAPQTNLQQLATTITGPGVTISNPVINCHAQGYGTFTYSGNTLGLDAGVLLTSGKIADAVGPNNVENKSFEQGTGGNSLLNVVTGRSTRDACLFEFDIIPSGDSLRFNFVLGSEEYNEWVGSQYNDVFGFFISGPGITGDAGIGNDHNIALVPGTNQAVTINNVNNGSNSAHYYDNAGGQHIQYDGLTRGLYAESAVHPCQTYHLKLVVADASDRKFDSGVFIERIRSNQVVMTSHTVNGTADMVEGCNPGWVEFTRPVAQPTPLNLTYFLHGTATNGTDYTAVGNVNPAVAKTITIPANETTARVNVNPIADGIAEGTEHLLFILGNPLCPAQNLDSLAFEINDTLVATLSPATAYICRGDSIQLHVNGGANYAWNPSATLSSATSAHPWAKPLTTTTYTVVVTDGTCTRTMSRQVRVSNVQLTATNTRPLCHGASNGALNLTVSGGAAPYTFNWTGPNGFTATTEDLINIGAGTYTVVVTDGIGCTRTQSYNVGSPAELTGTLTPSIQPFGENIACNGGSTGTLSLALTGGTAPYSINWTGPNGFTSTNQNLSGLRAGMFNVSVSDANGCTFTSGFNMTEPTVIAPVINGVSHVGCFGVNTGEATVEVGGGLLPYSYNWNSSPAQNTATATGLAPGNYMVTVTDGYGCAKSVSTTITGPSTALSTSAGSTTHVSCFGGSNGAATVGASGGTAPYAFAWNTTPVQHTATATDLTAGTWTCTVTDANGCTATRNVTITQPAAALAAGIGAQTNVNCFGGNTGNATISVTGGTAPYGYAWNTTPAQNSATANNLAAGTWTCTITDAKGCTTTQSVTITQPAAPLATSTDAQTNVNCFGGNTGNATIGVTGGTAPYTYAWNTTPAQNSATANNLISGTWTCTVTDANGCTTTRNITITQPAAALATSIGTQTNVSCLGGNSGAATVNVTGGTAPYTYNWNTTPAQNSATASGLTAGTWACTVTDANGCSTTRNVIITQPAAALAGSLGARTNVSCFGGSTGSATVSASGGTAPYTYSWNTTPAQNTATATGLTAGTWTCTITDAKGCTTTQNATITQPAAALAASLTSQSDAGCFGVNTGSATVAAEGGTAPYTYNWNTTPAQSGATANNLPAGTWTATITDAKGCTITQSVTITQPTGSLSTSIGAQTNVGCFGGNTGSATITASGGTAPYTYGWNTTPAQNTATATGLAAGTWTCTVTDANGCSTVRSVTITQSAAALSTAIDAQTSVHCFGGNTGSATISASGGTAPYTYAWNTTPVRSTATANGLTAGIWTCTVTDANGCTTARNVTITQPAAALAGSLSAQTNVHCFGGNTGAATITANGGTAPYSYAWNTTPAQSASTATGLAAGTWTCTITDARGCTTTQSVTITQPAAALAASISAQTNVSCFGGNTGSATINAAGGTAPYTYSWNTTPVQSSATANTLAAGTWTCTVTDANGCTTTRSVTITQPTAALAASLSAQTDVNCFGATTGNATASATGGTAPYSYAWNTTPAQGTATANNLAAGTWTCTITDAKGCTTTQSVTIAQPGAALSANIAAQTNVNCFGGNTGSATITATGGTMPYSYNWNTTPAQSGATANNLRAGTWTCTITDA
ncbi:MAG: choice-of-anchor L domain-containing protein, partial [Flavobacteriales bacterium]|nr:choice-of-anchor L domain-containing protein [Flavobacteriales bacterium]